MSHPSGRPHGDIDAHSSQQQQRRCQPVISPNALSVRRSFGEHNGHLNVLIQGSAKNGVVLKTGVVVRVFWLKRLEPRLLLDEEENCQLQHHVEQHLEHKGKHGDGGDKACYGRVGSNRPRVRLRVAKKANERERQEDVNVEELEVGQIAVDGVEDHHRKKLRQTVGSHEFKHAKGRDDGASALLDHHRYARNVGILVGE